MPAGCAPAAHLADLSAFLRFAAVPVKARRDGWTAELQFRFVLALARGSGVDEAARGVGRTRQTAYALWRRAGAEEFAAAWDSAVAFADRGRGAAAGLPLGAGGSAIETLLVPRFYRGRLIGFVQREDLRGQWRGSGSWTGSSRRRGKDDEDDGIRSRTHPLRQLCPLLRAGRGRASGKPPRDSM